MNMPAIEGPPGYSKYVKVDVPKTPHDYAMVLIEAYRLKQECLEKQNKALKEKHECLITKYKCLLEMYLRVEKECILHEIWPNTRLHRLWRKLRGYVTRSIQFIRNDETC